MVNMLTWQAGNWTSLELLLDSKREPGNITVWLAAECLKLLLNPAHAQAYTLKVAFAVGSGNRQLLFTQVRYPLPAQHTVEFPFLPCKLQALFLFTKSAWMKHNTTNDAATQDCCGYLIIACCCTVCIHHQLCTNGYIPHSCFMTASTAA
jgi:hypothetical protein